MICWHCEFAMYERGNLHVNIGLLYDKLLFAVTSDVIFIVTSVFKSVVFYINILYVIYRCSICFVLGTPNMPGSSRLQLQHLCVLFIRSLRRDVIATNTISIADQRQYSGTVRCFRVIPGVERNGTDEG